VLWLKRHPQIAPRVVAELRCCLSQINLEHGVDLLLPIPLHPERERRRGFNQAQVMAEALAERTRLRVDLASVTRVSQTIRHRAGMDGRQRARSLKGAFCVRAQRAVTGRGIVVIDDLMTTSATANEVASVLLEAGARVVSVLTIARVATAPLWGKRLALS
jgi:ComF family protein